MTTPPLIFICYAGLDRPVAVRLHHTLDVAGLHPWCDAVDLIPGEQWDVAIPLALERAAAVLVLISRNWPTIGEQATRWYGSEEVARAIEQARTTDPRMTIVPVRLDGVGAERQPYGLRRLVEIEASSTDLRPIVDGITRVLERRARTTHAPDVPMLNRRLAEIERHITTLEATGAAEADLKAAITEKIDIKRSLRAGGQLKASDALDRYVLAERLGQGGFASVWRAWDPVHGRHVALKVLHGRWNADASKVERFRRGAKKMARLKHPSVVPVHDVDLNDNGWHFFVMAWMPGGDLYRAITRDSEPMSADEGLRAVLEVADALAVAHRSGVVHRDVKPQNILLDADGRAKLSDFDLVRALDTSGGTGTGAMGTFLYAAPEQLDRPQDVGPRADVYALGMTAVFVLTGKQPETTTKWQPDAAVARLPATAPVQACLLRAIALSAPARHADAAVFASDLRAAMVEGVARSGPPAATVADSGGGSGTRGAKTASPDESIPPRAILIQGIRSWLPTRAEAPARSWVAWLIAGAGFAIGATVIVASTAFDAILMPLGDPPEGFVEVPAGAFTMGSPEGEEGRYGDEGPQRTVTFTRPLWVQMNEVTHAEWAAVMKTTPSYNTGCLTCPVERVNWFEAVAFANERSKAEGLAPCYTLKGCGRGEHGAGCAEGETHCDERTWRCDEAAFAGVRCDGYRLPTEAEWEYFARAGSTTRYGVGDTEADLGEVGWYGGNSGGQTHPVGLKAPNRWWLHDVHGNVWEWCHDWKGPYPSAASTDPTGPPSGVTRVMRGGAFGFAARWARSAYRVEMGPGARSHGVGFRLVRTP